MSFVHLHQHSNRGSFLDAYSSVEDIVKRTKELKQPAFAITEHGVAMSLQECYKVAKEQGVKFIPGVEFYYHPVRRGCKELGQGERKRHHHLTVLAKNEQGYRNLLKLASIAATEGFYYNYQIDKEVLFEHKSGLIVLSGCVGGHIPSLIYNGDIELARQECELYVKEFGEDFFLEIQKHPIREYSNEKEFAAQQKEFDEMEDIVANGLLDLGDKLGIPMVLANDTHYVKRSDSDAHSLLFSINLHDKMSDPNRLRLSCDEFYIKSRDEMAELFPGRKDLLDNTLLIADRCNVSIDEVDNKRFLIPSFPDTPKEMTESEHVRKLCYEKMDSMDLGDKYEEYKNRLEFELEVINGTGFSGYFLILQDIVNWGKKQGIPFNVGRGSAAGSYVSYLLGITGLDPIKFGLLFERFLQPGRISLPDVDLDCSARRRGELIEYIRNKYGSDHVCQIMTIGELGCKSAIKKVMTAYEVPFDEANGLTDLITLGDTIQDALKNKEVQRYLKKHPHLSQYIEKAKSIEGLYSHSGVHAAGIIITNKPVSTYTAIKDDGNGNIAAQNTLVELESGMGLLKIDLLGLRNLDVLVDAVESIEKNHGIKIDWLNIELDDEDTFKIYQNAETDGIFQCESTLFKSYLPRMKPDCFDDIGAIVALLRPGCLTVEASDGNGNLVDEFIRRKSGESPLIYPHIKLEKLLKPTQATSIYQEQIMEMSKILAAFTPEEAGKLQKAISKKIMEDLENLEERFISGCINDGTDGKVAKTIFDTIKAAGGYLFNKSHAYSYGYTSYVTAYFKAHYPVEFMAALLSSSIDDVEKLEKYLSSCNDMGVKITPPDINISNNLFVADKYAIRYSLSGAKGVGSAAVQDILSTRERLGKFDSFQQFVLETDSSKTNKTTIEALIKAGAFDSLGYKRAQLLAGYEEFAKALKSWKGKVSRLEKKREKLQSEPWDDMEKYQAEVEKCDIKEKKDKTVFLDAVTQAFSIDVPEFSLLEILDMEKELLGFYISAHPLDWAKPVLEKKVDTYGVDIPNKKNRDNVVCGGSISKVYEYKTRYGTTMAFVTMEDKTGKYKVTIPPRFYDKSVMSEGTILLIKGFIQSNVKYGNNVNVLEVVVVDEVLVNKVTSEEVVDSLSCGREILIMADPNEYLVPMSELFESYKTTKDKGLRVVVLNLGTNALNYQDIHVRPEIEEELWKLDGVINVIVVDASEEIV